MSRPGFSLVTQRIEGLDGAERHAAWCPWCETLHQHGASSVQRGAHCSDGDGRSPLTSYDLDVIAHRGAAERAPFPVGPMIGRTRFWKAIDAASRSLRRDVLAAIFGGARPTTCVDRTIGVPPVSVSAYVDGEFSLLFDADSVVYGSELLSLIASLFVIPHGVAAVRILEASTAAQFDARAALEIAAAVDGWIARGAPKNEGRRS